MENIHRLQDCNFSERISDIIINYPVFSMYEHILKNGSVTENVTEPVIIDYGNKSVIMFQIGALKQEIAIPKNEWEVKKKRYYVLQILQNPRKSTKNVVNFLVNNGNNGSICYVKRGSCAMVYFELQNEIHSTKELKTVFDDGVSFSIQPLKRKPNLEESLSKWYSLETFLNIF